jgi:hypothetical protein
VSLKSAIQVVIVLGFLAQVFVTAVLIAFGYFDFLQLHGAAQSIAKLFQTSLSLSKATPDPVLTAIGVSLHTTDTELAVVFKIVKMLACVSLISSLASAISVWRRLRPRPQERGSIRDM